MLIPSTPFPQVGSYALTIDTSKPLAQQSAELVRILRKSTREDDGILVSFPQRLGASGTRVVDANDLIDGTPLTSAEQAELAGLEQQLFGKVIRSARLKEAAARRDALKSRSIWAPALDRRLRDLRPTAKAA